MGLERLDAEHAATAMDIPADKVGYYRKDRQGIGETVCDLNNAVNEYRATGKLDSDGWKRFK